jgi:predicted nucleic acid-binding protein
MRVCLDACTIVYLLEAESCWRTVTETRLAELLREPGARLVTSRLSRLECRVAPLREGDTEQLARYDDFFDRRRVEVVEVDAAVIERATELRARHRFRTPDAIHLATAIESGADLFLTGDRRLERCSEVPVEVLRSIPRR